MEAVSSFKYLGFDNSLPFVVKPAKSSLPCSQLFRPNFGVKYGDFTLPRSSSVAVRSGRRSRVSYRGNNGAEHCFRVPTISCSMVDGNGEYKEMEHSSSIDCQQDLVFEGLHHPTSSKFAQFSQNTWSISLYYFYTSKLIPKEGVIDLKLPRKRLLVSFTCDACGAQSQRLISRLAYERGLVYVQCSGCSQYHKLVDNLGLVFEYNLQEEIDIDVKMDQV